MKFGIKKRILSFVLCICMIAPIFTDAVPVYAVEESDYQSNVGCTAVFNTNGDEGYLVTDCEPDENYGEGLFFEAEEIPSDLVLEIIAYKLVTEKYNDFSENGETVEVTRVSLWYQVKRLNGTLPNLFQDGYWVMQNYLNEEDMYSYDSLIIIPNEKNTVMDSNGNEVSSIAMSQYEKPEFVVESNLSGNVSYQWQIEYAKDQWVDIIGETSEKVQLSYGLVANLLDADNSVNIRCKSFSGETLAYSNIIPVTIQMYVPSEEIISESFTTSTGEAVNVTISGNIPSDASLDLEDTNADDVEVGIGEVVTAAFDISIKNLDGTIWQPASGESVDVTLPASACGLAVGDEFVIYHLHGTTIEILGPFTVDGYEVTFTVDGFSKFIFALVTDINEEQNFDYSGSIGKHAHFTRDDNINIEVMEEEPNYGFNSKSLSYAITGFSTDFEMEIVDYKIVTQQGMSFYAHSNIAHAKNRQILSLWYKIRVVQGIAPEGFDDGAWILQNYISENDAYPTDAMVLFDAPAEPDLPVVDSEVDILLNGEKISEITINSTDKIVINAANKDTTVFTCQWQILIPGTDMWVDINGETGFDLTLSYGVVANLLDSNGQAKIRCISGDYVSDEVTVTVASEAPAAFLMRSASPRLLSNDVVAAAEGDTYSVIVQYVFSNGDTAAPSWTISSVTEGYHLNQVVNSPEVLGYEPKSITSSINVGTDPKAIVFDTNVNRNIYITVTYEPINVKCVIEHRYQPVNGSNNTEDYILFETVEKEGLTGSSVGSGHELTGTDLPAGFYSLLYDTTTTIAANGTTVITIYYDRYFYLMNFVLDGGYGAEPIYARVGAPLTGLIKTPVKSGYSFDGWKAADGTVYQVESFPYTEMPAAMTTFTAQWTAGTTSYDVVFWYENADDNGYTQVGALNDIGATAGQMVNGETYKDTSFTGKDANNFTYSHADHNVEVKGDGSTVINVYFKRNVYTMCFVERTLNCENGWHSLFGHEDSCYTSTEILTVNAKFDADISMIWTTSPIKDLLDQGWVFQSSITNKYYSFLEKMPDSDITLTATSWSGNEYKWYYCLEVYPGMDTTNLETVTSNNKTYYIYDSTTVKGNSISLTYEEDYYPITGFTQRDNNVPNFNNRVAYLYYTRNTYNLSFSNYGSIVSGKGGDFLFEQSIADQSLTPDYPTSLEPNAYVFEGWYESPFFGDTKFEFDEAKMPARNVTLYARWVPKEHNVNIYLTDEKTTQIGTTQVVGHRGTATEPEEPNNGAYTFVGWFYMDGSTEKAFDFSMPITQDMDLYAKWSSNVLVEYVIHYQLTDGTPIAADTTGSALAGTSKTFDAKTGDQLNEGFRTGYYPITQSNCVVRMTVEGPNEYTFIYASKSEVNYTVRHVIKETGEVWHEETKETSDAIVTESFIPKTGYMPDAYSKVLVLTADAASNVITFYYTKDEDHAPVHVVHMIQNAVGEGYTLYQEFTDLSGVIGSAYSTVVQNISGYDFNYATTNVSKVEVTGSTVSGTVAENGLEIIIYYDRELHPYEFKFLEQGTDNVLADSVTGTGRYASQISQNAKSIVGYTCISGDVLSMTIQIEDGTTAVKNVKVFYYVEQKIDINYVAVWPDGATGFGSVTPEKEQAIPALTGSITGSTAIPGSVYKFVGWFYDVACTRPITDESWINGTKIIPQKNPTGLYESATYYAKFEYNLTSLTIKKQGCQAIDPNQTFLFEITDEEGLKLTVTVHENGSVTVDGLTVGKKYKIVENSEWSWRYTYDGIVNDETTVSITDTVVSKGAEFTLNPTGNMITFTNERSNPYWLDGDSWCNNIFKE